MQHYMPIICFHTAGRFHSIRHQKEVLNGHITAISNSVQMFKGDWLHLLQHFEAGFCVISEFSLPMPFGQIYATQPTANAIMFANCYLI